MPLGYVANVGEMYTFCAKQCQSGRCRRISWRKNGFLGGEGTVDGKNVQFHVKTRVPLDYTGMVDDDTMKGTMSSRYVRGRFLREKELGSADRNPRHVGLVRICAGGAVSE